MADDRIITIYKEDERYPRLLAQITDPPKQLYCRGDVSLLNSFCLAVVGTRKISDYGRQACRDIVSHLAVSGVTVVSGLAIGIDAMAHLATLDSKGKTIAVLGTGIENLWPKENEALGQRIIDEGSLIVSEYPGTMPGARHTFPIRNRIISGLSRGTLVVEADRESGSLITAKSALDQNRDVFAVPGSIYWPRSIGANWLIQEGARPVMNGSDILQTYQLRNETLPGLDESVSTQDPVQTKILAILNDEGPTHLDAIAIKSGFESSRVMGAIALLELHGRIRHTGAGIYSI
jgi:DNA processing protein